MNFKRLATTVGLSGALLLSSIPVNASMIIIIIHLGFMVFNRTHNLQGGIGKLKIIKIIGKLSWLARVKVFIQSQLSG
ncbi:hypothetical protein RO967_03800 [Lactiplantibacillus plantarum]|nr:hypothetical protein [Lactiplantibacillus plantarum]